MRNFHEGVSGRACVRLLDRHPKIPVAPHNLKKYLPLCGNEIIRASTPSVITTIDDLPQRR
jgi:hypothetical protein